MERMYPTPKYSINFDVVRPGYWKNQPRRIVQKTKTLKNKTFTLFLVVMFMLAPWTFTPSHSSGKVIYAQEGKPKAPQVLTPLPTPVFGLAKVTFLKPVEMPKFKEVEEIKPVWVNKLAPMGTYASTDTYAPGNCTWYVASRLSIPQSWGNANTWDDNARAAGYTVTTVPQPGAIGQTDVGWAGHVTVVESVNGDGTVTVSEMNVYGLGVVDTANYPVGYFTYIYP
jgi:surface antigen